MIDAAIRRQQIEDLCGAAIRALAGDPELRFRASRLQRGWQQLPGYAPHLHPVHDRDDYSSFRGATDGLALRIRLSDPALHARLAPADMQERMLFGLFEQFRVESLATLPGTVRNLSHRHAQWSMLFRRSLLADSASGILLYTVIQVVRGYVTSQPLTEETQDFVESTRFALAPAIGRHLPLLRRNRQDQQAYAPEALAVAREVGLMLRNALASAGGDCAEHETGSEADRSAFLLMMDLASADGLDGFATAAAPDSGDPESASKGYRIWTTAYDVELRAAELLRRDLLADLRTRLDGCIASRPVNLGKIARALELTLGHPSSDGWDGGMQEGRIDGRTLAQLVASPGEPRIFRKERPALVSDALVSFLIDCSGSMRQHAEAVAVLVDVLARALDLAGARSEILGFTTRTWDGGRPMREWLAAGSPGYPGRLNEALHIVFKDADTSWRRARRGIAALLKPDLFREGIDGEALQWACARLRASDARRRVLLVISDGAPADSATRRANGDAYLARHLCLVAAHEERARVVGLGGVGMGVPLGDFYRRSEAVPTGLAQFDALLWQVVGLIARCA